MSILIIAAHPDDEVLGMGGTIKKLSKKNKVHLCVVTEGASAQYTSKNMIEKRKESCIKSGKILGISTFDFNQLNRIDAFNNFAIQGQYPPGSVFKVVAYWLAQNEGLFPEGINSRKNTI